MKNLYIIIALASLLFGCSKSGSSPKNNTATNQLMGKKFKQYKFIDTIYNYQPNNGVFYDIQCNTMFGDTLYLNVGSSNVIIQPNPQPDYDPAFNLDDTLVFKTATTGITSEFPGLANNIAPFTYSLTNHTFTDDQGTVSGIIIIDDNNIELIWREKIDNGKRLYASGVYFRKL